MTNAQNKFILFILWCSTFAVPLLGDTPQHLRSQVEGVLDSWSDREHTRRAILKLSLDPLPALVSIAKSDRESEIRRTRAIALLGTFGEAPSEHALDDLTDDRNPKYRCLAIQSLAELKPPSTVPMLIRKLDDRDVCMKTISTDPAEEHDVFVSDEAVRLLEQITGQSFDQESTSSHRGTRAWKTWWASRQRRSGPAL
jgi:hypothetical protein